MRSAAFVIAGLVACTGAPPPITPTTVAVVPDAGTPAPIVAPPVEDPDLACGAFEEQGDDDVGYFVSDRESTWEPGTTLDVVFLDGDPAWRKKVAEVAKEWERYANITFAFDPPGVEAAKAKIRVSFQGGGHWSAIGSTSLNRKADAPTMNLNFKVMGQGDREIHRVVLHEFGHSIGLWHEHQNPNLKVTWNKEYMYAYYARTQGWNKAKVDFNLLTPLSTDKVDAKPFDAKSIMLYPMIPEFTVEKMVTERNYEVSDLDKKYIGELYPGRDKPKPDETMAAAKQVKLAYTIVADVTGGKQRFAASIAAPDDVLAKIQSVGYQRQGPTFGEYAKGTYFNGKGRDEKFGAGWIGTSIVAVKTRIVWKSGIVTSATYTKGPVDKRVKVDWKKIADGVAFSYLQVKEDDKWSLFSVAIPTTNASLEYIASIDYQRQHETFAEFRGGKTITNDKVTRGFIFPWRGYSWVPLKAIVHFKNGDTKEYAIAGPPKAP